MLIEIGRFKAPENRKKKDVDDVKYLYADMEMSDGDRYSVSFYFSPIKLPRDGSLPREAELVDSFNEADYVDDYEGIVDLGALEKDLEAFFDEGMIDAYVDMYPAPDLDYFLANDEYFLYSTERYSRPNANWRLMMQDMGGYMGDSANSGVDEVFWQLFLRKERR